MKNFKFYFVILLLALTVSCKEGSDFLDPEAVTGLTYDEVFTDASNTMRFLTDIYGRIVPVTPQGNAGSRFGSEPILEVVTDNAVSFDRNTNIHNINTGNWNSLNPPSFSATEWINGWGAIRACNMFLANINDVPENAEYGFNNQIRAIRTG